MNEPVTIGNQTFIRDPQLGWIDKKTKIKADQGLVKLLNSLQPETEGAPQIPQKKKRIKIDTNIEPVSIGGQSFVFDINSSSWIDAKTKQAAPPSLQKILTETVNKNAVKNILGVTQDVEQTFGIMGQIAKGRVALKATGTDGVIIQVEPNQKTKRQKGATPVKSSKNINPLNPLLVQMINHLASIDNTIKNMSISSIQANRQASEQADEDKLEGKDQVDAMIDADKKEHATRISKGTAVGAAAVTALLVTGYIDPMARALNQVVDFTYDMGTAVVDMARTLNKFFGFFNGDKREPTPAGQPDIPEYDPNNVKDKDKEETPPVTPPAAPANKPATPNQPPKDNRKWWEKILPEWAGGKADPTKVPPKTPPKTPPSQQSNGPQLKPEVARALAAANAEYKQRTGKDLPITSKARTRKEQQDLWDMSVRQGHPGYIDWPSGRRTVVAPVGRSPHQRGDAVDVLPSALVLEIMKKYGFYRPNPKGDDVHFELQGGTKYSQQANQQDAYRDTSGKGGISPDTTATVDTALQMQLIESGKGKFLRLKNTGGRGYVQGDTFGGRFGLGKAARASAYKNLSPTDRARVDAWTGHPGRPPTLDELVTADGKAWVRAGAMEVDTILARQHNKDTIARLKKRLSRDPTLFDMRGANWLGEAGYGNFLKELARNPNMSMEQYGQKYNTAILKEGVWSDQFKIPLGGGKFGRWKTLAEQYNTMREHSTRVLGGKSGAPFKTSDIPITGPVSAVQNVAETSFNAASYFTGSDTQKIDYATSVNAANAGMGVGNNAAAIQAESAKMFADKVESVTPEPPKPITLPEAPNLNMNAQQLAPKQDPGSDAIAKVLMGYMKYFRINKIDITNNIPILTLPRTRTTIWNP